VASGHGVVDDGLKRLGELAGEAAVRRVGHPEPRGGSILLERAQGTLSSTMACKAAEICPVSALGLLAL